MGDRKRKFSHRDDLDHDGTIALLESLVAGLRGGELRLEHGEQALILRPGSAISMELDARHKSDRETLNLELSWAPAAHDAVLRIGSGAEATTIVGAPDDRDHEHAHEHDHEDDQSRGHEDDHETAEPLTCDAQTLDELPRARLYELAQALEIDGRSALSKRDLAQTLSEHDLGPHLTGDERDQLRTR